MTLQFWNVYNYIARNWYEFEYGQIEDRERWYYPTMIFLERFASNLASEPARQEAQP